MIKVNMFSSADKVKGQGVGSAYLELIRLVKPLCWLPPQTIIQFHQKAALLSLQKLLSA